MSQAPAYSSELLELPGMQILGEIGRGSQSIVYRVSREDQIFAVKIPQDAGFQKAKETLLQFRREAAVLARVRHNGIAEIIEVGDMHGHPYLVMEYVEGKTLASILEDGPLLEKSTIQLAKTLAGALSAVHRYGLIHRDIKPQNILINKLGNAKLIDFGFAGQVDGANNKEEVIGTFLYSAPEQTGILKRPVDARSDLYSLGVVLFECATGTPPFRSNDAGELIRQHAVMAPPSVQDLNPAITPALCQIIAKLLAKDPDDRYQSAKGLLADLENIPTLNQAIKNGQEIILGSRDDLSDLLSETPLIGRDTELAILRNRWNEVTKGNGRMVLVEGEPGSGKSRLAYELLSKAQSQGALILRGKGQQHNAMPLAPLRQAIDSHLRMLHGLTPEERQDAEAKIKNAAGELGPLLKRFSPKLAQLIGESQDFPDLVDAQDLFYYAVADFILLLAQSHPSVIIFIDDVQWIDDATKQVLTRLTAQMGGSPIFIICAGRNDRENSSNLSQFIADMGPALSTRLRLVPLLEGAISRLVASLLGGHQVDAALISQIATRTNGNPFAVSEYVRAMLDSGLLRPSWGAWIVDTEGLEQLQLPTDVVQLVVKRIGELSERTKEILRSAAVMGARFKLELLPLVCETTLAEVHSAFSEASLSRLVERGESGEYTFVHDRVQEALLNGVSASDLNKMHQKVADVLDVTGGEGADYIYSLARHYSLGEVELHPVRAYETSFAAGLKALENYAYEEAYLFLQQAYQFIRIADRTPDLKLEETFGNACIHIGRIDEALIHLGKALEKSTDPIQRAQLRGRITRIHVANFEIFRAKDELERAFSEINKPAPKSNLLHWILALWDLFVGIVFHRLAFLKGSAQGKRQEQLKVLAQLYEHAEIVHSLDFDLPLAMQASFRSLRLAYLLGLTRETVFCYLSYGITMAYLNFMRNSPKHYIAQARLISEQLGDPSLVGQSISYEALRKALRGEERDIESLIRSLDDHTRVLSTEDFVSISGALIWSFLIRGYASEAMRYVENAIKRLEAIAAQSSQSHSPFTPWLYSYGASTTALLGNRSQSLDYLKKFDEKNADIKYHLGIHYGNLLLFHIEQGELGEPMENAIQQFKILRVRAPFTPLHLRHYYVFQAYARLAQCMNVEPANRKYRLTKLREAVMELKKTGQTPVIQCHQIAIEGALARLEGKSKLALRLFEEAEAIAREIDCPLVYFEVARQRAYVYSEKGNKQSAHREARLALSLAVEYGWTHRVRQIRDEFSLKDKAFSSKSGSYNTLKSPSVKTASSVSLGLQRHLDALLQLSLASASILDPDQQARVALDQIVRLLGAERAFLFLSKEGGTDLVMKAGRDAQGNDLKELKGYSSTVVDQVRNTGKPLVVSGTEEGAVLGSQSAVAHNLRSIMAAPLTIGDRMVGVVYLDNRLAKGIFTEDDVKILLSLANHIAIALETARTAQIEMDRKALEKDLELAAAVQSLLLPKENAFKNETLAMAGFYHPATKSGGDWWWYDARPDGSLLIMLGDVTGHGAGSAMVTAAVASSFRTLQSISYDQEIPKIFDVLNTNLLRLAGDVYSMTMSAVEIHPGKGSLRFWSAGAPAMFIMNPDGTVDTLLERSTPLGTGQLKIGHTTRQLERGSRVFLFTDGVYEFSLETGRPLGLRRLQKILAETRDHAPTEARDKIAKLLKDLQTGPTLEDDMTFVIADYH